MDPIPSIEELLELPLESKRETLQKWNHAYRTGEALVSDALYDALLESLPENDELRNNVGFEVNDQRKTELPIPMYSMDKVKSLEEIHKWMESKEIELSEIITITPKYDGLSFLVQPSTGKAYTRGNGKIGQRSDEHFKKLTSQESFDCPAQIGDRHLIGEVIMPRKVFENKYAEQYRNPRNLVAGLFNQKEPDDMLADVHFITYGIGEEQESKREVLKLLDQVNTIDLPQHICKLSDLEDELLLQLFEEWNREFEIDGLILEIDSLERRQQLGREKNSNPAYSRAWKGFEAQSAETVIQDISYQVSKDGRLAAVGHIQPVSLDGVTVSNVTLYNAAMMEEKGWGLGAKVKIIRSGMVIPKIIETLEPIEPTLPSTCPSCQQNVSWDDNHIHLRCTNTKECRAILIQSMISFFKVLEIEEVGGKLVEQLYDEGYNTISKILKMTQEDFLKLDRFADKKSVLIYESIHKKLIDVPLEKLQHASGCFIGLGTKKLALLNQFRDPNAPPSMEQLDAIDGYSEISAKAYLDGIGPFWEFINDLPIQIAKAPEISHTEGPLNEMRFCFTGFRDKALESLVEVNGGKIVSGVNGKTTHLIAKSTEGSSSKLKKARDLGLTLWNREEFQAQLQEMGLTSK